MQTGTDMTGAKDHSRYGILVAIVVSALACPEGPIAATATIEGNVVRLAATGDDSYGGCMAMIDIDISDAGLDCIGRWVTFGCTGHLAPVDETQWMFMSARSAIEVGKRVELRVTDDRKHGDYCHATRIKVQDASDVEEDSDADGVYDLDDDVPLDSYETIDTDDDGTGNNADPDDDNDGVVDADDAFPLDHAESADTDGGGLGDNADEDDDNDGVPDGEDALPLDPNESRDADGDGIGDVEDQDDDNDGVPDTDADGDGTGDNADDDDDNDGLADSEDEFPLGTKPFDLAEGVAYPSAVTFANGSFYVVETVRRKIYVYARSGQRESEAEFDLHSENSSPVGIAYRDGSLHITDAQDDKVYAYTSTGDRNPDADFELDADNGEPRAIVHAEGSFYVVDARSHKVFAYSATGERNEQSDFAVFEDQRSKRSAKGMTFHDGIFYLTNGLTRGGRISSSVFAYDKFGNPETHFPYGLAAAPSEGLYTPHGIAYAEGNLLIVDGDGTKAYAFAISGGREPMSDLEMDPANFAPEGVVYAQRRYYVLNAHRPGMVFTYAAGGAHLPESGFRLDAANDGPEGVALVDGEFFVLDRANRVFVYGFSGEYQPTRDFDPVHEDLTPRDIVGADGRIFILYGSGDGSVFAYTTAGERDPDGDFELVDDNAWPAGMTYADGRFFVVNTYPTRMVFAYDASGARVPDWDVAHDMSNPRGLVHIDRGFLAAERSGSIGKLVAVTYPSETTIPCNAPVDLGPTFAHASIETYQGPLASVWSGASCTTKDYVPSVAGRETAVTVRIAYESPDPPALTLAVDGDAVASHSRVVSRQVGEEGTISTLAATFVLSGDRYRKGTMMEFESDRLVDSRNDYPNGVDIPVRGSDLQALAITFIPIDVAGRDSVVVDTDVYMESILDFFPVAEYEATVGASHTFGGESFTPRSVAPELLHRWYAEADADEFYHGIFRWTSGRCGYAYYTAHVAVSAAIDSLETRVPCPEIHAHELGHNLGLRHSDCGGPADVDVNYPYPDAGIGPHGGWLTSGKHFVEPDGGYYDILSYCHPNFISDYHYEKAFRHLQGLGDVPTARQVQVMARADEGDEVQSIALSGAVDGEGRWTLFRVSGSRMPAMDPPESGGFVLTLLDARERVLHTQPLRVFDGSDETDDRAWGARVPAIRETRRFVIRDHLDAVALDVEAPASLFSGPRSN